ncbi:ParB/RepB/Spo0J family partition protein [Prevotella sp. KH2C16]|uniref:ParB/RepB/Spo0J family partition protein n=1 Tax=Prevotella sp. KH2C16 TaxID=1855325 RepID=UPI0008E1DDD9|nr:ParB/RepB/Spo0J family partition protein [Prevotella sp. KH2C16]SFG56332.1 ParB-like nuclease domain-containing protein [Prevotella sp. KH2C16]
MEIEDRWKYDKVDINLIDEAELNANEMNGEDFAQLCDNIGKAGLSSVPCCYKKADGRYVMVSGHHRLRACKKVGFKHLGIVYVTEEELMQDEAIATQLSHNSLHGYDNTSILKKMFEKIQSVDFKQFAHVNIDEISPVSTDGISVFALKENFVFTVILYPDSFENLDELFGDIREQASKSDALILASEKENEKLLLKLQTEIGKQYDIKSPSITFAKLLELAKERLTEIRKEDDLVGSK